MSIALIASLPTLALLAVQVPQLTVLPSGTQAYDVSDNGSVVVGVTQTGGFRWTPKGGFEPIAGPAVQTGLGPLIAVSGDGSTIASDVLDQDGRLRAAIWQGGSSWSMIPALGSCDAFSVGAWDLNVDGSVLVGLAWVPGCQARGYRWDGSSGTVSLGTSVPGNSSRANGVDGDGSLVVGWQDNANGRQGARWENGVQKLFSYKAPSNGVVYPCGEAEAVNNAGTFAVGYGLIGFPTGDAWRWSAATDKITPLPQLPEAFGGALATDLTEDGQTVVGSTGGFLFERKALIWIDGQPQDLKTYVESLGGSIAPYTSLGTAMGISADGRTIVGFGSDFFGQPAGWVLELPSACPADLDGDGAVGASDLTALLSAWGSSGPADLDGNGTVGASDLTVLLGAWGSCG